MNIFFVSVDKKKMLRRQTLATFILLFTILGPVRADDLICNDLLLPPLNLREILVLSNVYGLNRLEHSEELMWDLFAFNESVIVGRTDLIERSHYKLFSHQIDNLNLVAVEGSTKYKSLLDIANYHSLNFPLSREYPPHTMTSFHNVDNDSYEYLWKVSVGSPTSNPFVEKLKTDYLDFVIHGYAQRLGNIDPSEFQHLKNISQQVKDRTLAMIKTTNGPEFAASSLRALNEEPDIEGVITAVVSRNKEEGLPVELLNDFHIERGDDEIIAEIGRFFVSKDGSKSTTPELISHIAHFLNTKDFSPHRLVIQVDSVHKRLFGPFGFKVIKEFDGIQGREFLMEVMPSDLKKNTMKLLGDWKDIDPAKVKAFQERWL